MSSFSCPIGPFVVNSIGSLLVFEEVKVRGFRCTGHVLTGHADESTGEIGLARRCGFVGENAGVELLWQPLPISVLALDTIGEMESLVVNLHADARACPREVQSGL